MSLVFQPRFGEDTYPIGRFILGRARALGLSRSEVVRRLGYREIGTGHRKFSTTLLSGVVPAQIANHLAKALEVDAVLVRAVFDATRQQKGDEAGARRIESERAYRGAFRPHLQVQTERQVPSPIFVAALMTVARLRIVRLPDGALTANDEARDRIIKTIIITTGARMAGVFPRSEG